MKNIRNFSIIAHIDHGKTTLTDAFLKLTHTVSDLQFQERMMDSNPIEREKGVTIKLAPVRMIYPYQPAADSFTQPAAATSSQPAQDYILNLIDTPGHVDFGYEVNRSLAACEGAILLIDATQGIQAQTLANFYKAKNLGLKIIPVINKIDLPSADVERTMLECMEILQVAEEDILQCSAKTRVGIKEILDAVVERIPPPDLVIGSQQVKTLADQLPSAIAPSTANPTATPLSAAQLPLKALIITSVFDSHLGAIAYVRVFQGILSRKKLFLLFSRKQFEPIQVGFFIPARKTTTELKPGEVGFVATGLKDIKFLKIGDTITDEASKDQVAALPGFKEPTPMVFMELYPVDNADFHLLEEAMGKLAIHDSALFYSATHSPALGNGLRVGFLGIFHAEVVRERLTQEFNLNLIATAPSVTYQILTQQDQTITINNPSEMPDQSQIKQIKEPIVKATIYTPELYLSSILKYARTKRGNLINTVNASGRTKLDYHLPLAELITDFHNKLKSLSSGFASLEYELAGFQVVDAVKVSILVNKEIIEALSFICPVEQADLKGRNLVSKLKDVIPKQLFEIPIQAALGGKIIARETIKAFRKDVTAKLYGGDVTRRMKLLRKQARGKKRMKQFGRVELNQEAFLAVLEE